MLTEIVEIIVDSICPLWFRKWFFTHKWNNPPTEYDIKYFIWILSKPGRFNRRIRIMSKDEWQTYKNACERVANKLSQ